MLKQLNEVGGFICAASDDLAPADRLIYALRDITATVESIPLIAASIMSKKIAEGTGALVLDVKVGNGAFMKDADNARALAHEMINLGVASGVRTRAVLTDMSQPLGMSAGNALEVAEALEVLRGRGPADVRELSVVLAEEMLQAAGLPWDNTERVLDNGEALAAFYDLVASQGGDVTKGLPQANLREVVMVQQDGYIHSMNAMNVGIAAWRLGAGRARKEDLVDHSAGVVWKHKVGDAVRRGDVLFELHANDPIRMQAGLEAVIDAVVIDENPCDAPDLVLERVG
jgi:thymidine phosphorylase